MVLSYHLIVNYRIFPLTRYGPNIGGAKALKGSHFRGEKERKGLYGEIELRLYFWAWTLA